MLNIRINDLNYKKLKGQKMSNGKHFNFIIKH